MAIYNIGDKVKIKSKSVPGYISWENCKSKYSQENGYYYGYVTKIYGNGDGSNEKNCIIVDKKANTNDGNYFAPQDLELINSAASGNKITNMTLKEKFLLSLKSEPEKSFRKAGITNGDDLLTEEGKEVFFNWLFNKNKEDFKKEVVDDLLKELEDEKK